MATVKYRDLVELNMWIIFQWPCFKVQAIDSRIATSPTRFISTVIRPALKDLGF
jgi:hypothetical protein